MTPTYDQHDPHIHRNCPLDSPGRFLVCLANIFTSVPLRIQKSKRHAARCCLPRLQSRSSLWSCAGYLCVRLCQPNATKYFKRFLWFLGKHLRIRASTHPDIHTAAAGDAKRKHFIGLPLPFFVLLRMRSTTKSRHMRPALLASSLIW